MHTLSPYAEEVGLDMATRRARGADNQELEELLSRELAEGEIDTREVEMLRDRYKVRELELAS